MSYSFYNLYALTKKILERELKLQQMRMSHDILILLRGRISCEKAGRKVCAGTEQLHSFDGSRECHYFNSVPTLQPSAATVALHLCAPTAA